MFISILLAAGNDSTGAGLALGWGFFLWPGVIDTLIMIFGGQPALTTPDTLLWIAAGVGGLTVMMSGIYRAYDWDGLGVPGFLLDVTWGLAGATDGSLLHIVTIYWGEHAIADDDRRRNNHRYQSGFRIKKEFAFTQGAVM